MHKSPQRGIALMLTLVIATLLSVLVGSFIIVNRSNSNITGNVVTRQDAYNACLSGLHHAWAELEEDQAWGAGGFPNGTTILSYPPSVASLRVEVRGNPTDPDNLDENYVRGEIVGTRDSFEVRLVNNLQNRHSIADSPLGVVPGRCVKLEILGRSGSKVLRLSSILRKKPYVDASALSRHSMSIELTPASDEGWQIRSKDPYINQVRSNREINAPSATDGLITFKDPPRGGAAMARDDITLGGLGIAGDPSLQQDSEQAAKGSFKTGVPEIEVPDLDKSNLTFPPENVTVPAGQLNFSSIQEHDWVEETVMAGSPPVPTTVYRQNIYHRPMAHHDGDGSTWVGRTRTLVDDSVISPSPTTSQGYQDLPGTLVDDSTDYPVLYGDDPQHQMQANLETNEITMSPGTTFEVDGDFEVTHDPTALQPHLFFGYDMRNDGEPIFTGGQGGSQALHAPDENSTALSTEGNFIMDGISTGFGSIFSEQEVQMKAKSGLRADLDLAVAIHGEKITFVAEEPPRDQLGGVQLQTDFEVYKMAINPGTGQNPTQYEGFWERTHENKERMIGTDPDLTSGLRNVVLNDGSGALSPTQVWELLRTELNLGDPPNFGTDPFGSDWNGPMTVDKYVRLREYAREGNETWLEIPGSAYQRVTSDISQSVSYFSNWADKMGMSFEAYLAEEEALHADVFFVGLVHAGEGGFEADPYGTSLLFEGALVSQGAISITNSEAVDFIYNRLYLDDVVRQFTGDSIELDQVFYKIQ